MAVCGAEGEGERGGGRGRCWLEGGICYLWASKNKALQTTLNAIKTVETGKDASRKLVPFSLPASTRACETNSAWLSGCFY